MMNCAKVRFDNMIYPPRLLKYYPQCNEMKFTMIFSKAGILINAKKLLFHVIEKDQILQVLTTNQLLFKHKTARQTIITRQH